ncbi:MAG: formate/nitrite transporter family protein [Nitrospirae bacterium]|nr:formate/nitrite transporter family protein [Nitrospirota bacterium]
MSFKTPAGIAETIVAIGETKARLPFLSMLTLALLAGVYIAFGATLSIVVGQDGASRLGVGVTRFLSGSVFSMGLILVIIAGAELFTGNHLMAASRWTGRITTGEMLRNWSLVYIGNFAGSLLIVFLYVLSGLWRANGEAVGTAAVTLAAMKANLPFMEALIRGIGCNWLVCAAVWLALAAEDTMGKILGIYFPIMAFVTLGFEHSVANMFFIPLGILLKSQLAAPIAGLPDLSWEGFLVGNLLPVTVGNAIGGVVFVALPYWFVYIRGKKAESR